MDAREEFLKALEEQKREYRRTLDGRISGMELLWSTLSGSAARAELERLERTAHSLAGSGAVFGYARLSEQARALEHRLHDYVSGAAIPAGTERAAVARSIAGLRDCVKDPG